MTEQNRSEHGEAGDEQTDIDQAMGDLGVPEVQGEDVRGGADRKPSDISPWTTTHGSHP